MSVCVSFCPSVGLLNIQSSSLRLHPPAPASDTVISPTGKKNQMSASEGRNSTSGPPPLKDDEDAYSEDDFDAGSPTKSAGAPKKPTGFKSSVASSSRRSSATSADWASSTSGAGKKRGAGKGAAAAAPGIADDETIESMGFSSSGEKESVRRSASSREEDNDDDDDDDNWASGKSKES